MKHEAPNFGLLSGQDCNKDKTAAREIFDTSFYNWLRLERGISESWARNLTWNIGRDLRGRPDNLLSDDDARGVALAIMSAPLKSSTVRHHLIALEYYMTYIGRPMKFKKPRPGARSPDYLSQEQIGRLIRATRDVREFALIATFSQTGARLNEVRMLDVKDIDFENHVIHFRVTKRDKPREVPMAEALERILRSYLAGQPQALRQPNDPVFRSIRGDRISAHALGDLIRAAGRRAGLPNVHPHALRHSFATAWVENDGDLFHLQDILGHADLRMTLRYFHISTKKKKEAFKKAAPKI